MRAISHSKHTKLKNYSKGVLINHTKISTNENFPLYSSITVAKNLGLNIHFQMLMNVLSTLMAVLTTVSTLLDPTDVVVELDTDWLSMDTLVKVLN